jgi:hypothetical protein
MYGGEKKYIGALVGKPEGSGCCGEQGIEVKIILKWIVNKLGGRGLY